MVSPEKDEHMVSFKGPDGEIDWPTFYNIWTQLLHVARFRDPDVKYTWERILVLNGSLSGQIKMNIW